MKSQSSGDNKFFEDALHQNLIANVELVQLAGYELSMPTMRDILRSAPLSVQQSHDPKWLEQSVCWRFLEEARKLCENKDEDTQADYAECRAYWMEDFCNLSEKTRSIIVLMFTKLAQAFTARPLRKLFSTDTTITPEATFDGKIIIVALDTQSYRLAGVITGVLWKYCWQVAVMRRRPAPAGHYLRPTFCWADEAAENFLSKGDSAFQAVARASAGCTVYLAQNVSQYRKRLGDEDAFEALMANLQTKVFHQNTGPTCKWASELLGEHWTKTSAVNVGQSETGSVLARPTTNSGLNISEQRRFLIEPSAFTTLKRGGDAHGFEVEAIWYMGGHLFDDALPFKRLLFRQR